MLIDHSLGEIYGPSVMGEAQPRDHLRAFTVAVDYCRAHDVPVVTRAVGQRPVWPESLQDARRRFALRFLQYLQRGAVAKRNFLIVTHGDCIGSVMSIMPDRLHEQQDLLVEKVDYGATILASRQAVQRLPAPTPKQSAPRAKGMSSVMPMSAEAPTTFVFRPAVSLVNRVSAVNTSSRLWEQDTEGSGQREPDKWAIPADADKGGPEVNKLTQKVMTGWNCETRHISVRHKKSKGSKLAKRLTALVEKLALTMSGPFSMQKVEKLLGAIPQTLLGDFAPLPSTPANRSRRLSSIMRKSQNRHRRCAAEDSQKRKMEMSHMSQRSASAVDKLSMKHYLNPLEGVQEDLERSPSKPAGKAEAVDPPEPERKVSSPSLILDGKFSDGPYSDEGSHVSLMSQEEGPGKPSVEPPKVPSPVVAVKPLNSSKDTTVTAASALSPGLVGRQAAPQVVPVQHLARQLVARQRSPVPKVGGWVACWHAGLALMPLVPPAHTMEALDVDRILSQLLEVRHTRPLKLVQLTEVEISSLCFLAREVFMDQPILLELGCPLKICGDVHGQYSDLLKLFECGGFPPEANYLFLGDYVDRGKQSLETICCLLAYKVKFAENFFLLRGNHECASINRIYGFYDECKRRYSIRLWKTFTDCFNCLPVSAVIEDKIVCMHGGLSPELNQLQQINQVVRPTDVPDTGLLCDLLWSDPEKEISGWGENDRGVSFTFGPDVVAGFLRKHSLDLVCRAHQVVEDGYEFFASRALVTLFSAPNYCGEFDNSVRFKQGGSHHDRGREAMLRIPDSTAYAALAGHGELPAPEASPKQSARP
eukprot:s218_g21.t2